MATAVSAQESGPPKLRIDLSAYPYQHTVVNDTDFTATINARLPGRFSYFSYINSRGVVTQGNAEFERSEQNLRYAVSKKLPLDLSLQGVLVNGDGNDFYQLGVSWRLHDMAGLAAFFDRINLIYRLTFQVQRFEFDDSDAWQMEHFFRANLSERIYISGFVDQTFDLDTSAELPDVPIVLEVQLGVRLFNRLYAVAEYRNNDFRVGNEENVAAGLEYKFRW